MNDIQILSTIFFIVAVAVGSLCCLIGIWLHSIQAKKERRCDIQTYGKVIDIISRTSDGSTIYYPKIEYSIGSTKYVKEYSDGSNPSRYQIGQDIEVFYNPDNYDDYYIANDNITNLLSKIFIFVGVTIFIIFGTIAYILSH